MKADWKRSLPLSGYAGPALVPAPCVHCGAWFSGSGALCVACQNDLSPLAGDDLACDGCGRPLVSEFQTCMACRQEPPRAKPVRSLWWYQGAVASLIKAAKFQADRRALAECVQHLAREMNAWTVAAETEVAPASGSWLLCPVPSHPASVFQRGTDFVAALTRRTARQTGLPWRRLLRRRGGRSQKDCDRQDRLDNLTGHLVARGRQDWRGADIILVDDVRTTGATLDACADRLLAGGAARVRALTLALD